MKSFEYSHSPDIDQAQLAKDRANVETRTHKTRETTWDDIANLKDQMNKVNFMIDVLPTDDDPQERQKDDVLSQMDSVTSFGRQSRESQIAEARDQVLRSFSDTQPIYSAENHRVDSLEKIRNMEIPDDDLIELTSEWNDVKINQEALKNATERNGNPNQHGKGIFIGTGNLPMSDESVYRHVGPSAIVDLMINGFVRNKREAAGALDIPGKNGFGTEGAGVYWNDGDSNKQERADMVIQANKSAAENGYVTKND